MLKLQSGKDGKLDIIFAEDAGISNNKIKRSTVQAASSAGRRKTREFHQSHVLPKKNTQSKAAKVQNAKKASGLGNSSQNQYAHSSTTKTAKQKQMERKPSTEKEEKNQLINGSNKTGRGEAQFVDAGVITQTQLNTIIHALKEGNPEVMASLTALQSDQKKKINSDVTTIEEMSTDYKETRKSDDKHRISYEKADYDKWSRQSQTFTDSKEVSPERNFKSGKSPSTTTSNHRVSQPHVLTSSFAVGAPGTVAYDHEEQQREKRNKWREELDEQIREKQKRAINNNTMSMQPNGPYSRVEVNTTHASQSSLESHQGTLHLNRSQPQAQPSAMASSFAIGAPGIVAFDMEEERKAKQRQYLADVREQIRQQEELKHRNTTEPTQQEPEKDGASGRYFAVENTDSPRGTFARRNFSYSDQMDKTKQEREKHLQHQKAIEEQVEEKRRKKMEEREKRIQEELEEERKLVRERETLLKQHEEEQRKQREKEETERQRLEALQERVREAYENAQRDKADSRIRKLRAAGHDVSKLEEKHASQTHPFVSPQTERESSLGQLDFRGLSSVPDASLMSTRTTKENRPVVNWGSSPDEERKISKKSEVRKPNKKSDEAKTNERHKIADTKSGRRSRLDSEMSSESRMSKAESHKYSGEKIKKGTASLKQNLKNEKQKVENSRMNFPGEVPDKKQDEYIKDNPRMNTKGSKQIKKKVNTVVEKKAAKPEKPPEGLVPFHRTSTLTLKPNINETDSEQEELTKYTTPVMFDIQRSPTVQIQTEPPEQKDVFTPRQQQILDQLQALRKGLMEKRQEHEMDSTIRF